MFGVLSKAIRLQGGAGLFADRKLSDHYPHFFEILIGLGIAKALAAFLFDSEKSLVRIDMSEYMEKHTVSRLIGAPPGYVGYDEGGQLTEMIRRQPYSVILLDEIEKAHHDVFNVLLQILDDGRLTDGQGRVVDFKNTIIIMTSNLGSQYIQEILQTPKTDQEKKLKEILLTAFRPEFINRVDEIILFNALTPDMIKNIVKIQMTILKERMLQKKITLNYSEAVLSYLAETGYDADFGARPLKRVIQREIQDPIANLIITGQSKTGVITIEIKDEKLTFE